jgi:hypothetical protein
MVRDSFLSALRNELGIYLSSLSRLESEVVEDYARLLAQESVAPLPSRYSALAAAALGQPRAEEDGGGEGPMGNAASWLLKRLHLFAVDRTVPVRALVALVRSAAHQGGAALCSTAYAHSCTGDPRVRPGLVRVFATTSAPLHAALRTWVLHGSLPSGEVELCVEEASASSVRELGPWLSGQRIAKRKLPTYLPLPLAELAVKVGKAVRFLRHSNGDGEWVLKHIVPLGEQPQQPQQPQQHQQHQLSVLAVKGAAASWARPGARGGAAAPPPQAAVEDAALAAAGVPALTSLIYAATALANYRLMQQILGRHRALAHLQVMHRYIFLTQGDFVTVLLAGMEAELDKPAAGLAMELHTLGGILEGAVRGSNAALEDRALTDCLFVQLGGGGGGSSGGGSGGGSGCGSGGGRGGGLGWDVFQLGYRVEPPLDSILHVQALGVYRSLFSQLWFMRRCEAALSRVWSACKVASSGIEWLGHPALARLLHTVALARMRMGHFLASLRGYTMLVLAQAWAALEAGVEGASDFDHVLAAHMAYLGGLAERVTFVAAPPTWGEAVVVGGGEGGGGSGGGTAAAAAASAASSAASSSAAREALDGVLRAVLSFTQEALGILMETEPLVKDARDMGIRARKDFRNATGQTVESEAADEEVRRALCTKLDAITLRRGSTVKVLTVAFSSQLDTLLREFSVLEAK